ncbi:MAG: hypothetical protein JOZ57_14720 [Abitibacteriaceae bacterium]|nr:hypothetical protein [Abditibacteriaceae bacterium]
MRARAEALDSGKYVCGNCIEPQPSFYGCSHCGTRLKGPPSFGAYEDASDSDYAKHFADGPEKDWKPQFDEEWKRKYEEFARKRQERAATQSDAPDT